MKLKGHGLKKTLGTDERVDIIQSKIKFYKKIPNATKNKIRTRLPGVSRNTKH